MVQDPVGSRREGEREEVPGDREEGRRGDGRREGRGADARAARRRRDPGEEERAAAGTRPLAAVRGTSENRRCDSRIYLMSPGTEMLSTLYGRRFFETICRD